MRIIAGTSGGIPIKVPKDTTRPTTDRVRESIFSSLGDRLIDAEVLDLFSGSGALGLECLSRGSKSAVFVDESKAACQIIKTNLAKCKLSAKGTVRAMKTDRFLLSLGANTDFDLIFADPPYAKDQEKADLLVDLLNNDTLAAILRPDGTFVLETYSRTPLPELGNWEMTKEKTYGETRICFLRH